MRISYVAFYKDLKEENKTQPVQSPISLPKKPGIISEISQHFQKMFGFDSLKRSAEIDKNHIFQNNKLLLALFKLLLALFKSEHYEKFRISSGFYT